MIIQYKFPEDFGGEVQRLQHKLKELQMKEEKGENIWDHWYKTEPNRFFNQCRS